jgi:hypothetical protein
MEMYAVPKDEVLKIVEDNGAKVLSVQEDFSCGEDWVSFRYFITK